MSTHIEWTDETWNPVVGCTKVSQGCKRCYAKTLHDKRHRAVLAGKKLHPQYLQPFETVQLMPERLDAPLHWRKPRRVFVNSVSDLFHEDVPDEFIGDVFRIMAEAERHTFQILTKRPGRMLAWFNEYLPEACSGEPPAPIWPLPNVWLGVSIENQKAADERIPLLLETPAAVRFLSCEPLLGPIELPDDCTGLDWVIVGGESGRDARQCDVIWIEDIIAQCDFGGVACFVKQLGSRSIMGYYDWLRYCDEEGFSRDEPVYVTTQWQTGGGGSHTYYRWYLGENGARHDGQPPSNAWVDFPSGRKGGDPSKWPEALRVREYPQPRVPA